tara:strand:- start:216 stop:491 length:276 start_codon:yes stop_codon:yes gene_type:complete
VGLTEELDIGVSLDDILLDDVSLDDILLDDVSSLIVTEIPELQLPVALQSLPLHEPLGGSSALDTLNAICCETPLAPHPAKPHPNPSDPLF